MSAKFTIKEILADHWSGFLELGLPIRPVVLKEVNRVLGCGDPNNGCALYVCPDCGSYKFVPFRCHSRFCNTCGTAYQANRANQISLKLINCTHRHVVFTIPEELRDFFRRDRNLLHVLFRSAAQVISDWLLTLNKKEQFTAGMVVALHTFGRDLKWNPHIHMLVTEGAVGNFTKWRKIKFFPFTMLRKRWQATLTANLKAALNTSIISLSEFKTLFNSLYKTYPEGFYVNAPYKSDFNSPMQVAKYITRYIGRPAMAQSRITDYDGENVTYWYQRHEDNEIVYVTEHAYEFFKKLVIHIPEKGFNMLRYYGIYAKPFESTNHLFHLIQPHMRKVYQTTQLWVFRIDISFHHDPLTCPCGGCMEFKDIYLPNSPTHPPPHVVQLAYQYMEGHRYAR